MLQQKKIIAKGGAEIVVVSQPQGAVLVTKDSYDYPAQMLKKSTVGAGDSMVVE
jgi:6-phosphofructokinase 2